MPWPHPISVGVALFKQIMLLAQEMFMSIVLEHIMLKSFEDFSELFF